MKVSAVRYLIDAGPWVGALSAQDQWHTWSARVFSTLDEPVFTSELVFGETCHLLRTERAALLALIELVTDGSLNLISLWKAHGERAAHLLASYPRMDAGDASLVVLSELHPKARIVTTDVRDFTYYRRRTREVLPLIHP